MAKADDAEEQDPRHAEPDRRKEEIGDDMAEPAQGRKHWQANEMPKRLRRDRRHGLVACEAGKLRHGDEVVALGAQGVDQLGQRRHGLRPVSAGIMQEDDVTADVGAGIGDLLEHPVDDDIGRRAQPVIGVDMQADRDIAHGLSDLDRHDLVARGRLGIAEERRAEQPHRSPGQRLEQPLR